MSLKSIAEKLAEDLAKVGKKLDKSLIHLTEAVDGIVAGVPKAQFVEKGFNGLPPSAKSAMLDGLLKVTDAAPDNATKAKIAREFVQSFRAKFPEGKAGDAAFEKFGGEFVAGLDDAARNKNKPEAIRQAGGSITTPRQPTPASVVAEPTARPAAGGPVSSPRQPTPPTTAADNPTVTIDARQRPQTRDGGTLRDERGEPTMDEPTTGTGGSGGGEPPIDTNGPSSSGRSPKRPGRGSSTDSAASREAKEAAAAMARAESAIGNSLTDMHTVRTTNGKMPKQAFFSELQDALRTKGLLHHSDSQVGDLRANLAAQDIVKRAELDAQRTGRPVDVNELLQRHDSQMAIQGAREKLNTPEKVYEAISARQPVSESEVRVLAEYFGRFHNDTKLADKIPPAQNSPIITGNRVVGTIEAIARRIPVSEGSGRTTATIAQNHAWQTGETSFWRDRVSSFQTSPLRTTAAYGSTAVGALALGLGIYASEQTYETVGDFQNPRYWGREVLGMWTPDAHKDIDDYAEYVHGRYNSNPKEAVSDLKKFYGIEDFSESNREMIVSAIIAGPKPPYNPAPEVTQGLTMFVSQKLYGKAVAQSAELKGLQNDQIAKANDKITREAETRKAEADKIASTVRETQEASRMSAPPRIFGGASPQVPATTTPEVSYTINGATFKQRLDDMQADGTLNGDLYQKLAQAFKDATKLSVSDAEELTAKNVAQSTELTAFAKAAEGIFSEKGVPKSAITSVVGYLVAPAPSP